MCVDLFDLCYMDREMNNHTYDLDQMRELLRNCHNVGIGTILWRLSACGSAVYRSEIEDSSFRKDKRPATHAVADFMDKYDPLQEGCRIGHAEGVKVYAWMCFYDNGVPNFGHYSKLLREHPEYQWVDRTGKIYCVGVSQFAYPEARAFRVATVKEVCAYPIDGLFLSLRSHSWMNPEYKQAEEFGYNQPIVKEYKRRYGVDITKEDFDWDKWHKLKGEYFTQLLRQIRETVDSDLPVTLCIVDESEGPCTDGTDGPLGKTRHELNYQTWFKENLVQGIFVQGRNLNIPKDYALKYEFVREAGIDLYCFKAFNKQSECQWNYIPNIVDMVKETPFNGIAIMEAFRFALGDPRW